MGRRLLAVVVIALVGLASPGAANDDALAEFAVLSAPIDIGGAFDAASCAGCHADIAREWRGSLHRASFTDPLFTAAYANEPRSSCRQCHAPLAAWDAEPSGIAADEGISCAVCHVREGEILAPSANDRAPHAIRVVPELDSSRFCASCHEFTFPAHLADGSVVPTREPMQSTHTEWTASDAGQSGVQCQSCHMPPAEPGAHRSHAFEGATAAMLSRAVHVEASAVRVADTTVVTARVIPDAIGHAFPTGDLFRRAELEITLGATTRRFVMARFFRETTARTGDGELVRVRRQVADTRVASPGPFDPEPIVTTFDDVGPTEYRLVYRRMPIEMATREGLRESDVTIVVASDSITVSEPITARGAL